jgi:hypothetical protein
MQIKWDYTEPFQNINVQLCTPTYLFLVTVTMARHSEPALRNVFARLRFHV